MNNKILIINFSLQKESQSQKVSQYLLTEIKNKESKSINYIDLNLAMWSEELSENEEVLKPIKDKLQEATGYIFVTPEYNGACTPALNNFCLFLGKESYHKPVLLVSVSAGISGSYPITEARSYGYKNTKLNYIPEHLIIRNAYSLLNTNTDIESSVELSKEDKYIRDRITYTLANFDIYCTYSKNIRTELDYNDLYTYGM